MDLTLSGLTTRLGRVVETATELSERFSGGTDRPTEATGIARLHRFADDENLIDVASEVALDAIENAGLPLSDVGGIVATSNFTHATLTPTFGPAVAERMGLSLVRAATVGTGCGGLAQAVEHAAAIMTSPMAGWPDDKAYVVLAADRYSAHVDAADFKTRYLFSDDAAAFVLRKEVAHSGDIVLRGVASVSLAVPSPLSALRLGNAAFGGDRFFRMETAAVARFVREVPDLARRLLGIPDWTGIAVIPHQANVRLLAKMRAAMPEAASFYDGGITSVGNALNASTLLGLEDALRRGTLASRDVALVPFGAEWVVGAIRLRIQD